MPIKVKVAKAHEIQLQNPEVMMEFKSIDEAINDPRIQFQDGKINFVFVRGFYHHIERKMETVCLFVNKLDKPINELYGVLRFKFRQRAALAAKATIGFDEVFMGTLMPNEALLVHMGIPVKGLVQDEEFKITDFIASFEDVRITFTE